jgi:transposase
MNTLAIFEFTAFIGIDWADTKHEICIQPAGSEKREFDRIVHYPEHIEQWALEVHKRFGGPIAVILELSKGPIVSALQKHDFFVLFPVNPSMLAKYREAFKPSRAQDDPSDAELAVDLVLRHRDRFKPLQPQSVEMPSLVHLVEKRRRLVEDRIRFSNRLISTLEALALAEQLRTTIELIKQFDEAIADLAPSMPDYTLFASLPGAGIVFTPRLLAAFGEDWDRFQNAAEVQQYCGVAPVAERSGQKSWVHWHSSGFESCK